MTLCLCVKFILIRNAFDAVFEKSFAKVDQQTETEVEQPKISEELFAVNRSQFFNRFKLNNEAIVDDQICTKSFVKNQLLIADGNWNLADNAIPTFRQFMGKNHLVNGFKQAGAKSSVNIERRIHNILRYFFKLFIHLFASCLCGFV